MREILNQKENMEEANMNKILKQNENMKRKEI